MVNLEKYIEEHKKEEQSSHREAPRAQLKTARTAKSTNDLRSSKRSTKENVEEKASTVNSSIKKKVTSKNNVVMKLSNIRALEDMSDKKKFNHRIIKTMVAGGKV